MRGESRVMRASKNREFTLLGAGASKCRPAFDSECRGNAGEVPAKRLVRAHLLLLAVSLKGVRGPIGSRVCSPF